jgi:hypothetical protein
MVDPTGVKWAASLVLAGTGCWFAFRATRPDATGTTPGVGERLTHVAHLLMAATMIAMMWLADPMAVL